MNKQQQLKKGCLYNVLMLVSDYVDGIIFCSPVIDIDPRDGVQCGEQLEICHDEISAFFPSHLANGTKNTEPAPKYDPCRLFRKGDKAKPRIINGRENQKMPLNVIFTVTGDEDEYGDVPVEYMSPVRGLLTSATVHAVWLELVTPVEELEPYYVEEDIRQTGWGVWKRNKACDAFSLMASYSKAHPHGKAAAEAERDRLNAEYRKEKEK